MKKYLIGVLLSVSLTAFADNCSSKMDESNFAACEHAAKFGNDTAQYRVGLMYQLGYGVEEDNYKAVYWYKKAAKNGNPDAQENLANMYFAGIGTAKDSDKAIYWHEQAANNGDKFALNSLGSIYYYGSNDGKLKPSYESAIYWYKKSATQNDNIAELVNMAALKLGYMYEQGLGTEQDYKQAMYWYQKVAESTNSNFIDQHIAQTKIGLLYLNGNGVQKDTDTAKKWFLLAAKQNDADALFQLGLLAFKNQNFNEAIKLYVKSSDLGSSDASLMLGHLYYNGIGVNKNLEISYQYYKKAVSQGSKLAKDAIGPLFNK